MNGRPELRSDVSNISRVIRDRVVLTGIPSVWGRLHRLETRSGVSGIFEGVQPRLKLPWLQRRGRQSWDGDSRRQPGFLPLKRGTLRGRAIILEVEISQLV